VVSAPIDLSDKLVDLLDAAETAGCGTNGTMTVTYEGSDDGISFTRVGITRANLSELSDARFLRFRVAFTAMGTDSPCLSGLALSYRLREIDDLELKGGLFCASTASESGKNDPLALLGDLGVLFVALLVARARFSRSPCVPQ
jgi:hypothetical protein